MGPYPLEKTKQLLKMKAALLTVLAIVLAKDQRSSIFDLKMFIGATLTVAGIWYYQNKEIKPTSLVIAWQVRSIKSFGL